MQYSLRLDTIMFCLSPSSLILFLVCSPRFRQNIRDNCRLCALLLWHSLVKKSHYCLQVLQLPQANRSLEWPTHFPESKSYSNCSLFSCKRTWLPLKSARTLGLKPVCFCEIAAIVQHVSQSDGEARSPQQMWTTKGRKEIYRTRSGLRFKRWWGVLTLGLFETTKAGSGGQAAFRRHVHSGTVLSLESVFTAHSTGLMRRLWNINWWTVWPTFSLEFTVHRQNVSQESHLH